MLIKLPIPPPLEELEELEEEELLLMMIFWSEFLSSSTCLPHLGHITHSLSICDPQNLQNFVLLVPIGVPHPGHDVA